MLPRFLSKRRLTSNAQTIWSPLALLGPFPHRQLSDFDPRRAVPLRSQTKPVRGRLTPGLCATPTVSYRPGLSVAATVPRKPRYLDFCGHCMDWFFAEVVGGLQNGSGPRRHRLQGLAAQVPPDLTPTPLLSLWPGFLGMLQYNYISLS